MIKGTVKNCTKEDFCKAKKLYTLTLAVDVLEGGATGVSIRTSTTDALSGLTRGYVQDTGGKPIPEKLAEKIQELELRFVKEFMDLATASAEEEYEKLVTNKTSAKVHELVAKYSPEEILEALEWFRNEK